MQMIAKHIISVQSKLQILSFTHFSCQLQCPNLYYIGTDAKKTAHSNYFVILIHFFIVFLLDMVKYLKVVRVEHKLSKKSDKN